MATRKKTVKNGSSNWKSQTGEGLPARMVPIGALANAISPNNILSVEQLLTQATLTRLDIPELDGCVYLRSLTAGIVLDMATDSDNKPSADSLRQLISYSVVDENGRQLFNEDNVDRLREMPLNVFNRISVAVMSNLNPPGGAVELGKGSSDDALPIA